MFNYITVPNSIKYITWRPHYVVERLMRNWDRTYFQQQCLSHSFLMLFIYPTFSSCRLVVVDVHFIRSFHFSPFRYSLLCMSLTFNRRPSPSYILSLVVFILGFFKYLSPFYPYHFNFLLLTTKCPCLFIFRYYYQM